ncbi:type III-B CRISPR module-associated protein Cmr5 [Larkinella sp. VNQ87]|uniref:type III-B CRISPR module-associated protein Cmr5 n=1 Tax=Larkinella sp. VNQ87 TaxID=3400921 RepID=UPI003C10A050
MRTSLTPARINQAIEAITQARIPNADGTVTDEFTGYIASFAAACIQSGLLPAVAFFENSDSQAQQDRSKLVDALKRMLPQPPPQTLFAYLRDLGSTDLREIEIDLREAIVALKLALRTFPKPVSQPQTSPQA